MYLLIEVIEREINVNFYHTLHEAQTAMRQFFDEAGSSDMEEITEMSAFKNEANNHNNYDWLIVKCPDKKSKNDKSHIANKEILQKGK